MKGLLALLLVLLCACPGWGGGEREAAAPGRAKYLAQRGTIIPRYEVKIEDLVASVDYGYPEPKSEVGLSVYTGHKQVSAKGQTELVLIGLQGKRQAFEVLPPMNLVLVVDKSGSMREPEKLDRVKESLAILLRTVRQNDCVALIAFDEKARLLVPTTPMNTTGIREQLLAQVQALIPGGESNIIDGVTLGFREAATHHVPGQTNRLILLTDGWGKARGLGELVRKNRQRGIEVTVVGYGARFDTRFADQVLAAGGGSSRFISDREQMEDVFGSGLARGTVALARDVELRVALEVGRVISTWGYSARVSDDRRDVRYVVPAVHSGDYETIALVVELPPTERLGTQPVVVVEGSYRDLTGAPRELDAVEAGLDFVESSNPVAGFSDARVLKAGTMLHYAFALEEISGDYYASPQLYGAFFRAYETKKELKNARVRLHDDSFDEEIDVLTRYMRILGTEIGLRDTIIEQLIADDEIATLERDRPLAAQLDNLFQELLLRLGDSTPGTIAVAGFRIAGRESAALVDLVNEAGAARLAAFAGQGYTVVERDRLDAVLRAQELALSELLEPGPAIQVGKILAAQCLVTGTIIPTSESVVVFGRIINVETARIESVAQVIIPLSVQVEGLLSAGLTSRMAGSGASQEAM